MPHESDVTLAQIGITRRQDDFKLGFSRGAVEFSDKRGQRRLQLRCAIVRSGRRPVAEVDHHVLSLYRVGK